MGGRTSLDREKCCDVACGDTSKFDVSGGAGAATQQNVEAVGKALSRGDFSPRE